MRLGTKAKLTIGIGLMTAGTFAFLGFRQLGDAATPVTATMAQTALQSRIEPKLVLAASTRNILTGETIDASMFRSATADPADHPNVAVPSEVVGKVATRDIRANTLIPRAALGQETKLAIRVPRGMRAVSIETTAEIAVAGLVRPGDRVDVQVVYPGSDAISGARGSGRSEAETLLQMVQVLAVGETIVGTRQPSGVEAQVSSPPPPARNVTLALSPEQVSALTLARSTGSLTLSLRNPDDEAQIELARAVSSAPSTQPARAPVVRNLAAPAPAPRPRAVAKPQPHAIELVVGGNKEVIYSGSGSR
ncbi:Flp pilus assembly protein CpaB [Novosphingobium sp. PP1Y]|uniref:Flp pilus assembly protein CpaB n=1 Tax=Novosphingobium sp. PP1Y TaxID=702113 RepID=UPI00020EFBD8|nr:Flp pilus assembly protein CpaB [Novosphingobium sp. PP1Y]CCA90412.1 pilus assembly protein CpaB [Novosphingobium sp. PP1Y]